MKCPNCGEPIETRHTFCVICGADLAEFLAKGRKADFSESARSKVYAALTKPIRKPKQSADAEPAPKQSESNGEPIVFSDNMQPNV